MVEAVRHGIGADTLGYISQQGMIAATEQPASRLCSACFDGNYPIELPGEIGVGQERHRAHARDRRPHRCPIQADNDNASALAPSLKPTAAQSN